MYDENEIAQRFVDDSVQSFPKKELMSKQTDLWRPSGMTSSTVSKSLPPRSETLWPAIFAPAFFVKIHQRSARTPSGSWVAPVMTTASPHVEPSPPPKTTCDSRVGST